MTYTTNTGRVLTAIIYDGTNTTEINSLVGFSASESADDTMLIGGVLGGFYVSVGDYVVHTPTAFVEVMDASNFE